MKQPKKLTRDFKEVVSAHRLNPNDWMLTQETEFYIHIIHKTDKTRKILDKNIRRKNR